MPNFNVPLLLSHLMISQSQSVSRCLAVIGIASMLCFAGNTAAGSVGSRFGTMLKPDIYSGNISGTFNESTRRLELTGSALQIFWSEDPLDHSFIYRGNSNSNRGVFDLDAEFDSNGDFVAGGFEVKGVVLNAAMSNFSVPTTTLLSGTITELAYSYSNGNLQLEFEAHDIQSETGLESAFGDFVVGNVMSLISDDNTATSILTQFSVTGGTSDVARAVPEPLVSPIFAFAICSVISRRRRRPR
ncbi:hypothetical protein [Roseiconus lacunae]|uniref:PEP-CTERM sorting domain-containing protein n=1 Tax=Roseiconus lacunae TaxID=2605694 RepID=A0ABT7PQT1_9BACT|nr:hypothetical protein [Roseiconus lacunae]MDM4018867.1 hypothetical protein [Roseiconus lacunae]